MNTASSNKQVLVQTSHAYCRQCVYSDVYYTSVICDYMYRTGKHRDCSVGWCDKFEPRFTISYIRDYPDKKFVKGEIVADK